MTIFFSNIRPFGITKVLPNSSLTMLSKPVRYVTREVLFVHYPIVAANTLFAKFASMQQAEQTSKKQNVQQIVQRPLQKLFIARAKI